jgi:hypothetical protein
MNCDFLNKDEANIEMNLSLAVLLAQTGEDGWNVALPRQQKEAQRRIYLA